MTPLPKQPQSVPPPPPVLVARDWLLVVILLLVMSFLWIGFGIYKAITAVDIPQPLKALTAAVVTDIDTSLLEELSRRQQLRYRDLPESDRVKLETQAGSSQPATPAAQP